MDAVTRRRFLLASGMAAGLAGTGGAMTLAELLRTRSADAPQWTQPRVSRLVLVTLYGGNDGLNTVVPYADPAYHAARPALAYRPEDVLPLDRALGLNPALRGLKSLWDRHRLAIVLGAGYPKPNRSHFRSMDIWQSASPAAPADTGWIGRWLDGTRAPDAAAVSFEPVLPPVLAGATRFGSCVSYRGLTLPDWTDSHTVSALGHDQPSEPQMQARAAASYADLVTMQAQLRDPAAAPAEAAGPAPAAAPEGAFAMQLGLVARCVEAEVPTRVYSVSLGGFDTHAQERAGHESLLRQLDGALTAFVTRMSRTEVGRQVVVVVYSEFGRRVRGNGSQGTDHGTAGPVFVLGPRVAGGFRGKQPSLTDLDDGDLKAHTDFRDVYGAVLASVLDAEPERYLAGYRPRSLRLFTTD